MDKTALVESQIDDGARLVQALDKEGLPVSAALWFYYPDAGDWRLLIALRKYKKEETRQWHQKLAAIFNRIASPQFGVSLGDLRLIAPNDPLVRTLKKIFRVEGLGRVRASHNRFNGIYVEDALIYRMT